MPSIQRGSVRQRAHGHWEARWYDHEGIRKSSTFDNQADAREWLNGKIDEVHALRRGDLRIKRAVSSHGWCVVPYDGKRGRVWRIKYVDGHGKQIMETLGAEQDGVTREHAFAVLRRLQEGIPDDPLRYEKLVCGRAQAFLDSCIRRFEERTGQEAPPQLQVLRAAAQRLSA